MTNASEVIDDEYEEYDEFDEEDDERGLSGFSVLVIGLVMIGAFISVVWIAYQQGIKTGAGGLGGETPYVAADPEPIKIETAEDEDPVEDREVYDVFDGEDGEEQVTVLAQGPEEPVTRDVEDTIGSIAAEAEDAAAGMNDEVEDRLASLQQDDAAALDEEEDEPAPQVPTPPSQASTARPASSSGALAGSHVVQVGAFSSDNEAMANWGRMQTRFGDYLSGKSEDVEVADVNGKTYYRLRVGPFSSYEDATEYCAGLKQRGGDCLIKKL